MYSYLQASLGKRPRDQFRDKRWTISENSVTQFWEKVSLTFTFMIEVVHAKPNLVKCLKRRDEEWGFRKGCESIAGTTSILPCVLDKKKERRGVYQKIDTRTYIFVQTRAQIGAKSDLNS
jgi:hypothetical protein